MKRDITIDEYEDEKTTPVPDHFTVLAFDPRELGESDSTLEPCTMAVMADDHRFSLIC
ncbi:alpha/beta fold hydrolase [Dehalobacterium formicoaceticum]|uniref:Uncharacterized protein n=1 Tax=Dehalobacterium formicoaceticum TaxID=51515 RepID=A0ABT1Y480_9FIRM|nr:hypothetical protein [Dehalobacterium formicoaceticum]MCR6545690.1 hypothetical protein [Dehalobacterium formicoaceticum]